MASEKFHEAELCAECRFSEYTDYDQHHVLCRRHAPSPLVLSHVDELRVLNQGQGKYFAMTRFPTVSRDD
jgi:hypothetical protein